MNEEMYPDWVYVPIPAYANESQEGGVNNDANLIIAQLFPHMVLIEERVQLDDICVLTDVISEYVLYKETGRTSLSY